MEVLSRQGRYAARRWIARFAAAGRALVSIFFPGLLHGLRGRGTGILYAASAAGSLAAGAVGSAIGGCTCGFVVGLAGYALAGALGALRLPAGRFLPRRGLLLGALALAVPVGAVAGIRAAVVDLFDVESSSMAPTLWPGDTIFVSRLTRVPRRGDLVVFRGDAGLCVKRVAALEGDRVALSHGELRLNGERAPLILDATGEKGSFAARYYTRTGGRPHWLLFREPWALRPSFPERVIPRGHVFVLGDNRDRSDDSRRLGVVPVGDIVGRPFSLGPARTRAGGLRWARLGTLL